MRVRIMRAVLGSAVGCLFSVAAMASPIVATPSTDATSLANALVASGGGVTVNSATYTGGATASGTFTGAGDVIGIDTGILLTTGNATFVTGPNNNSAFTVINGAAGDADLGAIVGTATHDASVLNINFTPSGSQVSFSYVFGSEEYNEFVSTQYNDVFAFFVNGVNFALIPGTSTPVSINNVNNGNSSGAATGPCTNCAFYVDNSGTNNTHNTQLDGFTTVLSFLAPVNAGVPNTLKLAIADTADAAYDSAVFLQGGSLQVVCGTPGGPPCPEGPAVPEPASLILLGTGLATLYRRHAGRSNRA